MIDNCYESLCYSLFYILLIVCIFLIMGYYLLVYLGWSIGFGEVVFLIYDSVLMIVVVMYFVFIVGVFVFVYLVYWMVVIFGVKFIFI